MGVDSKAKLNVCFHSAIYRTITLKPALVHFLPRSFVSGQWALCRDSSRFANSVHSSHNFLSLRNVCLFRTTTSWLGNSCPKADNKEKNIPEKISVRNILIWRPIWPPGVVWAWQRLSWPAKKNMIVQLIYKYHCVINSEPEKEILGMFSLLAVW